MIRALLLAAFLVAIFDPALLYIIYSHAGGWAAFLVWFVPVLIGNQLAMWHSRTAAQSDPVTVLATAMINPFARMLLWYPGPITSALGLLMLFPLTRRIALRVAMRRLMAGAGAAGMGATGPGGSGAAWSFNIGGAGAQDFGGMAAAMGGPGGIGRPSNPANSVNSSGLKRAEGRVVDESPAPEKPKLPPGPC